MMFIDWEGFDTMLEALRTYTCVNQYGRGIRLNDLIFSLSLSFFFVKMILLPERDEQRDINLKIQRTRQR